MSRILITIGMFIMCCLASQGSTLTGFRHITVNNGLPRNGVLAILPSSHGPIYIGTWDGLFVLNGTTVSEILFTPSADTPVRTVNALTEDHSGNIWVATSKGLIKYNIATDKCSSVTGSESHITSLFCDSLNRIHFVENNRTYKILNQTDNTISASDANGRIAGYESLPEGTKIAFTDSRNHIFAATRNGDIFEAAANSNFLKIHHSDLTANTITEHNGKILIGSNNGITVYNPSTKETAQIEIDYSNPDGINDRRITTMTVDFENGLWIGTFYGGINYLSPTAKNFSATEDLNAKLSGHVISGITRDTTGTLWFGIEDSGIASYNFVTGEVRNFTTSQNEPDTYRPSTSNIQTIFADDSLLYVGTSGHGMDIINIKSMQYRHFQDSVNNAKLPISVYSFARDKAGTIWIGTMSGLFTFNPKSQIFTPINNVPKAIFHCLVADSSGTIWAASQGAGLYNITPKGEIRHYQLPSNMVMSVCPIGNTIYAGTEGDGIFSIDKQSGLVKPLPVSLPERLMVFTIIADGETIWFSTNKGLMHYDPSNNSLEHYTEADGLRSNQFKINSGLRLPNGQIMMGSVSGLYAFKHSEIIRNSAKPTAYLTAATYAGNPDSSILAINRIEIPAGNNDIEFLFTSSSNANPEKNRFEFMLEPCDDEWKTTDNSNPSASYTDLKAGSYTFRLRTSNGNGIYSDERRINVIVQPAQELPLPIKALLAIIAVSIITTVIFIIYRRKNRTTTQITDNSIPEPTLADAPHNAPSEPDFLIKLNAVIDEHIDNSSLTIDDLASYMAMGRSSFFAKVKELTGQTPNDYLRSLRLKRAAALLESGSFRINEVAYKVGFASPSYFARRFAAAYGTSPAEYQAAACKKNKNQ